MIEDLLENNIRIGLSQSRALEIIGQPDLDTIGRFLKEGVKIPDTLIYSDGMTQNEVMSLSRDYNFWFKENSQNRNYWSYFIGWNIIDPEYLYIIFDKENKIERIEIR